MIFFYGPDIFTKANLGIDTALFYTTLVGAMNIIFTIIAMRVIDKMGRKKLMLIGAAGMAVCYTVIGLLFSTGRTDDWLLLTFILITPAFFADLFMDCRIFFRSSAANPSSMMRESDK